MATYIYCRLSQDSRAGVNYSLDKQEQECRNYCDTNGLTIKYVHRIVGSARGNSNCAYIEGIIDGMNEGDTLIVYDVTRFSRNTLEGLILLQKIVDKGARVRTIKENLGYDTMYDRLAFRQLLSLAEFESDQTSERIKTSVVFRQQNGIKIGPAPYGYEAYKENGIRKLRRSISENKIIVSIRNMFGSGMGIDEVVSNLNETCTYRGKKWTHDIVLQVYKADEEYLRQVRDEGNGKDGGRKRRKESVGRIGSNKRKKKTIDK